MIWDFWGIREKNLSKAIEKLEEKVETITWKAIDSVRHVGNIGAHMKQDVNLIIDVEPDEAGLLIGLIEDLFEEWYIRKHDRERKMKELIKVAQEKKAKRTTKRRSEK